MPFDRAALLGCGVMTGVGAATRIAALRWGDVAMVIGCGAVGLSAVQGCVLAGAGAIVAVRPQPGAPAAWRSSSAPPMPSTPDEASDVAGALAVAGSRRRRGDRGGRRARRLSACRSKRCVPAARSSGSARSACSEEVAFRWGSLMQEKRITRSSSYGGARPQQDFPLLARAYLEGRLKLDEMISARIRLEASTTASPR